MNKFKIVQCSQTIRDLLSRATDQTPPKKDVRELVLIWILIWNWNKCPFKDTGENYMI